MDDQEKSRQRSPRRDRRERERDDEGRHNRDRRQRDSRSQSPARKRTRTSRHDVASEPRSRDPESKHRPSHRHRERSHRQTEGVKTELPFSARPLSKGELSNFEPLLAYYLSLQKQKDIEDMDDREVRGRWKSFVGKWNRGELAEGWYDPEMYAKIMAMDPGPERQSRREENDGTGDGMDGAKRSDEDEDEDYGPVLPPSNSSRRSGPGIPSLQDLSLRAELNEEDRQASITALRAARKADRTVQKERLDDIVPRAEAGTRERQLEKRQMVNEKMRDFRERSPGMAAGDEKELMGGGDELQEYKRIKEQEQRKKTDREIRREEVERAKREEMEERRRAWKEREDGTMGMLRELARQRFG